MAERSSDNSWHAKETFKGLMQLSAGALRSCVYINGGAAVALLAFLGRGETSVVLSGVKVAMVCFVAGVLLGALASIMAYLAQLRLYQESVGISRQSGLLQHRHLVATAAILSLSSVVLFGCGSIWGAWTMSASP